MLDGISPLQTDKKVTRLTSATGENFEILEKFKSSH